MSARYSIGFDHHVEEVRESPLRQHGERRVLRRQVFDLPEGRAQRRGALSAAEGSHHRRLRLHAVPGGRTRGAREREERDEAGAERPCDARVGAARADGLGQRTGECCQTPGAAPRAWRGRSRSAQPGTWAAAAYRGGRGRRQRRRREEAFPPKRALATRGARRTRRRPREARAGPRAEGTPERAGQRGEGCRDDGAREAAAPRPARNAAPAPPKPASPARRARTEHEFEQVPAARRARKPTRRRGAP